jgi:hypothetical protein
MSLISKLALLASSPQGRRMVSKATGYAKSPEGKAKLEQIRRQVASRRGLDRPR